MNTSKPNRIYRELQGVLSLNPFENTNSASRKQMFSSHISQRLVIACPTVKKIQTGMEMEYGKYTFHVKMPENGRILKVIHRYPENDYIKDGFKLNPETLFLYESEDGVIGMVTLERYQSLHPEFGYEYKRCPGAEMIQTGASIAKDTIFLDSPCKGPNGEYNYGAELNVAYMTHPCVSEDGMGISRDVLSRFNFRIYEKRVVEWGKNNYPLNLYGDDENYKPFPDIGEYVHPNGHHKGLLMALREYDPNLLAIDQSIKALQTLDPIFDKATYVQGECGRVVDIKIYHQPPNKGETICDEMMVQPIRYRDAMIEFRSQVLNEYFKLKQERGEHLRITPELQRYIVETMAILNKGISGVKTNLQLTYKTVPVDEWRAEFVVEYVITPNIGSKFTDIHGGKSVITHVFEPHEMPVAKNGLRADVITDGAATFNRMNNGRLYEQYLNSIKYDLENELMGYFGIQRGDSVSTIRSKIRDHHQHLSHALQRLNRYHDLVSPKQGEWMRSLTPEKQFNYLVDCLAECIIDYHPTETERDLVSMVDDLNREYPSCFDKVQFTDENGNITESVDKIRIGSVYMMLLEKIGNDWSSIATSKTQHNGIISFTAPKDKHASPTKQQATRVLGESEIRVVAAYAGGDFAIEMHDRSNALSTRKAIVKNILNADKPTDIDSIVDREVYPLGYSKPLQLTTHIMNSAGYELAYKPFDPSTQVPAHTDVFLSPDTDIRDLQSS